MFKIGDGVEWASGSRGVTTTKRGVVEVVVPPKCYPTDEQRKEADAFGRCRDHVSYMVRVPGKSAGVKAKLYWPRARSLTSTAGAEQKADLADEKPRLLGLLREVRAVFVKDTDLPGDLLHRIDVALGEHGFAAAKAAQP